MPYERNADLPATVREALPAEAQTMFRTILTQALAQYDEEGRAFATAWAGLRRVGWKKDKDGTWHKIEKNHHPGSHHAGESLPSSSGSEVNIEMPDGSMRKAVITMHGNTKIVVPKDLDAAKQNLTIGDLKAALDTIPAEHRGAVQEVRLLDVNIQAKGGRNATVAASFNVKDGHLEFYANSQLKTQLGDSFQPRMQQMVRHETAHAVEAKMSDNFRKDWVKAIKKDGMHVSDYAKTDLHEDVAETMSKYWGSARDRRELSMFFSARTAVLERYKIKAGG